jgi:hypothetical protein
MKRIFKTLVVLGILIAGIVLLRNVIVRLALPPLAKALAGVQVAVGEVAIGLRAPQIALRDVQVMNPAGFPAEPMLTAPEIYLQYSRASLLQNTIRVLSARLHIGRVVIGRNAQGAVNVHMPPGGGSSSASSGTTSKKNIAFERLHLVIDKVVLKDYSVTPPREFVVPVNLDEEVVNLTNHAQVVAIVVERAMQRIPVDMLAQQGMAALSRALGGSGTALNSTNVQAIIRDASTALKSLLNRKK